MTLCVEALVGEEDGDFCIKLEDQVLITEDGFENLTFYPFDAALDGAMPTERFTFAGHAGDALAARLDLPEGPHLATALFAHCFTCGKDIPAARRIAGGWRRWGSRCCASTSPGWGIPAASSRTPPSPRTSRI
jgi:hypothetical protein